MKHFIFSDYTLQEIVTRICF